MWQLLVKFVRAPELAGTQAAARARLLHVALWISAIGSIPIAVVNFQSSPRFGAFVLVVGGLSLLGVGLNHAGRTRLAAGFLISLVFAATVYTLIDGRGLYDSGVVAPPIIIILATFYFGLLGDFLSVVIWIVTLLALSMAGANGYLPGSGLDRPVPVIQMVVIDVLLTAIGGLVGVVSVIWERNLAELGESRDRLELALQSANVEAWTWNIPHDELLISDRVVKSLGLESRASNSYADFIGRLHPDDRPGFERALGDYLAGRGEVLSAEYRTRTADGRWLWRLAAGRITQRGDHAEPEVMTGVMVDLTELRETSIALLESERRYRLLTQELHDSVTQTIYSMTLTLKAARKLLDDDPARVPELMRQLEDISADALQQMREMLRQARPEVLDQRGLTAAIVDHLAALKDRYGLEIELESSGDAGLDPEVELALYRVTQEALTNIVKHAGVKHARVDLKVDEQGANLRVSDEGAGFDLTSRPLEPTGFGLENMRQRVQALGGTFELKTSPANGTVIEVEVPRAPAHESRHG